MYGYRQGRGYLRYCCCSHDVYRILQWPTSCDGSIWYLNPKKDTFAIFNVFFCWYQIFVYNFEGTVTIHRCAITNMSKRIIKFLSNAILSYYIPFYEMKFIKIQEQVIIIRSRLSNHILLHHLVPTFRIGIIHQKYYYLNELYSTEW